MLVETPAIKKLGVPIRVRVYEIHKGIEYITTPPRMTLYMQYAATIYSIFLKFILTEDIHVYSINESFLDITSYMELYKKKTKQLKRMILDEIYDQTGITATVGIGTNLFLAKVVLDITEKHAKDCMGYLDEDLFKQLIGHHQPITDIWIIGNGTANILAMLRIKDLYGVANCDRIILYKILDINAEYLIDHA